ncbi:unnamed protein product [Rotaria sordida]|uniref:eRF1 domain-containing protein n=1 Tax=Rotaria sordida TaxID=392033 RepID=A0A813XF44_9BILA|nr:unnamed protein product [Rotaria sordida]
MYKIKARGEDYENVRKELDSFVGWLRPFDLPRKRRYGGASALRQARLRNEKRYNYIQKVSEVAVQCFITDGKVNVTSIILAIEGTFTSEFQQPDIFDPRLQEKLLQRVIISYGGENGFNQAIDLASETLSNIKLIQEKKVISRYFDEVSKNSNNYCFGVDETLKALEMGAVETLIVWENFDVKHYFLHDSQRSKMYTIHLCVDQEEKLDSQDKDTDAKWEHVEKMPLLEWFAKNCKKFGILRPTINFQNSNIDKDAELIDHNDNDYTFFFD